MKVKGEMKSLSRVRLLVTPWTAALQAPPSMGFSRQEDWSGVPLPSEHRKTQLYLDRIGYCFTIIIADKLMDIGVNVQKQTSHSWWDFSFTTSPITQKWVFSIV